MILPKRARSVSQFFLPFLVRHSACCCAGSGAGCCAMIRSSRCLLVCVRKMWELRSSSPGSGYGRLCERRRSARKQSGCSDTARRQQPQAPPRVLFPASKQWTLPRIRARACASLFQFKPGCGARLCGGVSVGFASLPGCVEDEEVCCVCSVDLVIW